MTTTSPEPPATGLDPNAQKKIRRAREDLWGGLHYSVLSILTSEFIEKLTKQPERQVRALVIRAEAKLALKMLGSQEPSTAANGVPDAGALEDLASARAALARVAEKKSRLRMAKRLEALSADAERLLAWQLPGGDQRLKIIDGAIERFKKQLPSSVQGIRDGNADKYSILDAWILAHLGGAYAMKTLILAQAARSSGGAEAIKKKLEGHEALKKAKEYENEEEKEELVILITAMMAEILPPAALTILGPLLAMEIAELTRLEAAEKEELEKALENGLLKARDKLLEKSIECLSAAIHLRPNYAWAWRMLAAGKILGRKNIVQHDPGSTEPTPESLSAIECLGHALAFDPSQHLYVNTGLSMAYRFAAVAMGNKQSKKREKYLIRSVNYGTTSIAHDGDDYVAQYSVASSLLKLHKNSKKGLEGTAAPMARQAIAKLNHVIRRATSLRDGIMAQCKSLNITMEIDPVHREWQKGQCNGTGAMDISEMDPEAYAMLMLDGLFEI